VQHEVTAPGPSAGWRCVMRIGRPGCLGVNFNIVVTRSSSQTAGAVAGLEVVAIGFLSLYGWRVVGWANRRQIGAFKEFSDQSPDSA
jgi:hypothetical protein